MPPAVKRHRMAQFELLLERPVGGHAVVHPAGDLADLRIERTTESDVELLKAPADAEDRHAAGHAFADQRQRHRIAVGIEGAMFLGRRLAVMARMHVRPPAGKDEAVAGTDQIGDRTDLRQRRHHERDRSGQIGHRLDVRHPHRLHGIGVVRQMGVADDADHGPGHEARRRIVIDPLQIGAAGTGVESRVRLAERGAP